MKTTFIFFISLSAFTNAYSMGAKRPKVNCLDTEMKERILDSFNSNIDNHSDHGRSFALYEIDQNAKVIPGSGIEANAFHKRPVASIQKIVSAFMAFDHKSSLPGKLRYSSNALKVDEASSRPPGEGHVHNDKREVASVGEDISFNKTMTELLARSANGAGYMIAENIYISENQATSSIANVEFSYAFKANAYAKEILPSVIEK